MRSILDHPRIDESRELRNVFAAVPHCDDSAMKILYSLILLVISNGLMTLAWYGHLKQNSKFSDKSLLVVLLISWGIAFFEYCFMIPANRLGHSAGMSLAQLKIAQEVITIAIFIPFALFYMGEKWKMDYLWAFLCMLGAVFFVNRESLMS